MTQVGRKSCKEKNVEMCFHSIAIFCSHIIVLPFPYHCSFFLFHDKLLGVFQGSLFFNRCYYSSSLIILVLSMNPASVRRSQGEEVICSLIYIKAFQFQGFIELFIVLSGIMNINFNHIDQADTCKCYENVNKYLFCSFF